MTLEWDSSASNDMIADSTLALITGIDTSPASVKRMYHIPLQTLNPRDDILMSFSTSPLLPTVTSQPHSHSHQSHAPDEPHPHADIEDDSAGVTRIQRLAMFLEAHFGEVELHMPEDMHEPEQGEDHQEEPSLLVRLDEADASISLLSLVRTFILP